MVEPRLEPAAEMNPGGMHQSFLNKQTPADKALHCIVDNYSTHKQEAVKKWLQKNKRVHPRFIPAS